MLVRGCGDILRYGELEGCSESLGGISDRIPELGTPATMEGQEISCLLRR